MGPYRDEVALERLAADGAEGQLELELAPEHVALRLGDARLVVAGKRLIATRQTRRREVRRELGLERARLLVARGYPGRGLALWVEGLPGVIERVWAAEPRSLLDDGGLEAARAFDRLAARATEALSARGASAVEYGHGGHRVVLVEERERLVVFARPLFRERPRRVLEVHADGTLVVPDKQVEGGERRTRFRTRFDVVSGGDRIRFAGPSGADVAQLYLPWIPSEHRAELARRLAELVDPAPPDDGVALAALGRGPLYGRRRPGFPLPRFAR